VGPSRAGGPCREHYGITRARKRIPIQDIATWLETYWRNKSNDYEFGVWCNFDVILHHSNYLDGCHMPRQSISLTDPSSEWLKLKVEIEGEYRSNSEAVNDLIRKAREIEDIRARLIQAEQSGFTEQSRDEIRAEIRKEMRRNGEL
jgi:antitoxin ParD1/3/4